MAFGVAAALAVLESTDLAHGRLKALFTIEKKKQFYVGAFFTDRRRNLKGRYCLFGFRDRGMFTFWLCGVVWILYSDKGYLAVLRNF